MGIPVTQALQDDYGLAEILQRADDIKQELQSLSHVLRENNVDMETPLVDAEAFPRADIDVVSIRIARARINQLKNDYHVLTDNIQAALHALHAQNSSQPSQQEFTYRPFARVHYVIHQSPAALAGLKEGDLIKKFGSIHEGNHEALSALVRLVQISEEKEITLLVTRKIDSNEVDVNLTLIPQKNWGGNGSLGAHIIPL